MFDCVVFDQCTVHLRKEFINMLKENNIKWFLIPPGCTGLLQPLDIAVNKSFKSKWNENFNNWFYKNINTQKETKTGRIKGPTKSDIISLMSTTIKDIEPTLIIKFFKLTGFSSNLNNIY